MNELRTRFNQKDLNGGNVFQTNHPDRSLSSVKAKARE